MDSMGRTLSSVHLPILDELSDLLIYEMKRYVEVFNQTPSSNCWANWTTNDGHFVIQLATADEFISLLKKSQTG